jgi:polyisoprenoid-binding protein YceI
MRRIFGLLILAMAVSNVCDAKDVTYSLNGDNTKVEWTGTKAEGKHDGGFKRITGTATRSNGGALKFDVEIDCTSLYSDNEMLTQHLKSPDFFAVKEHPKAKFKSTKIEKTAGGAQVTGDLTLLGKTKKVSFPAKITVGDTLNVEAEFVINRQDFGMSYGKGKVNDDVEIRLLLNAKN